MERATEAALQIRLVERVSLVGDGITTQGGGSFALGRVRVEVAGRPLLEPAVLGGRDGQVVHPEMGVVTERVTVERRHLRRRLLGARAGRVPEPAGVCGP